MSWFIAFLAEFWIVIKSNWVKRKVLIQFRKSIKEIIFYHILFVTISWQDFLCFSDQINWIIGIDYSYFLGRQFRHQENLKASWTMLLNWKKNSSFLMTKLFLLSTHSRLNLLRPLMFQDDRLSFAWLKENGTPFS